MYACINESMLYVWRMFVYLYVFVYLCMYVCMYVCMDGMYDFECVVRDGLLLLWCACITHAWLHLGIPEVRYSEGSLFRRFVSLKI